MKPVPSLVSLGLALGLCAVPGARPARSDDGGSRRQTVVVALLSSGVRAKEMLDAAWMPEVAALAEEGISLDEVRAAGTTPWSASTAFLTGRMDVTTEGDRLRPSRPTFLEVARRALDLPERQVWFVGSGAADEALLARSDDPAYGAAAAPSIAGVEGAFGEPLADLLESWGRPLPTEDGSYALLRRLRLSNRAAIETWLPREVDAGLAEAEATERALLVELDRKAARVGGPVPEDERAVRAALTILQVHRPRLLVVRLGGAAGAQGSAEAHREILAALDHLVGRLASALSTDERIQAAASIWVVSDMGRNEKPNARGGLETDDESAARRDVALVARGTGLRRGASLKGPRTIADVASTLCRTLGFALPDSEGTVLEPLLAGPGAGSGR